MATRIIRATVAIRLRNCAALIAALLCSLFGLQPVAAQDSATVTVDIGDCVELESAAARLECFGSQVDAVLEAQGAAVPEEPPAVPEVSAAGPDAGSSDESLSQRERRAQREAASRAAGDPAAGDRSTGDRAVGDRAAGQPSVSQAAEGEYFGTIVDFRERIPFSYVITLDNGQVWEQVEPKKYPLRPGLEVRIYPTKWGKTYRLSGEGTGGYIRVRRVQ